MLTAWLVFPLVLAAARARLRAPARARERHDARAPAAPAGGRRGDRRRVAVPAALRVDGLPGDAARRRARRRRGTRSRGRSSGCASTAGRSAPAVVAYLAFAAPVLGLWRRTFAGYIKLDDTATYLAMLDRYLDHGYNVSGLAPSTYERDARDQPEHGLPDGLADAARRRPRAPRHGRRLALAALPLLPGRDARARALRPRRRRSSAPARCARSRPRSPRSSALLYGYSLWGGIKELAEAMLLVAGRGARALCS